MRDLRFFLAQPLAPATTLDVGGDLHHHLANVLRAGPGSALVLFNGDGADYPTTVLALDRKTARLHIDARVPNPSESPLHLTLYQALLKGEAFERVLQKATELGVQRIVPLLSQRCAAKGARLERWRGIVIASAMQCGRSRLPELDEPRPLAEALRDEAPVRWLFSPHHGPSPAPAGSASALALLIGPEGGFSDAEVAEAVAAGWQCQRLGPRILRADTAATVALARAQERFGDF